MFISGMDVKLEDEKVANVGDLKPSVTVIVTYGLQQDY